MKFLLSQSLMKAEGFVACLTSRHIKMRLLNAACNICTFIPDDLHRPVGIELL